MKLTTLQAKIDEGVSLQKDSLKFGEHVESLTTEERADMNMAILKLLSSHSGVNIFDIAMHHNYPAAFHILVAVLNELRAD